MTGFSHVILLGLAILGLTSCGASSAPPPSPSPAANSVAPREDLSRIVERYWDERASPWKPQSAQELADSLAVERRYLAEISAVPRASLDADAKLTYDIFKRQRELDLEGFTYPSELLPLNSFAGQLQRFIRAAAGAGPPKSAKDAEDWSARIDGFVLWTKQAIVNMRDGMRRGYTLPRVVVERTLPLLQGLGEDSPANVFYAPLGSAPQSVSERLAGAVKDKLLPAFRELHAFLQTEYLPRARTTLALSALPLGPSWYAYRVKRATSTQLTPGEIHSIGVAEVERLRARLPPAEQGAPPPAAGDSLNSYQELKTQTLAVLPTAFSALPSADVDIRAVDLLYPAANSLVYQPAEPQSGTPAILYVNSIPGAPSGAVKVASFLQEAIPGRHFAAALAQERSDLPKFRRFGAEPAFVDGWALYAASLGEELGLYRDADATRSFIAGQLQCAAALVVDTGVHAENWTRAQAVDYIRSKLALDEADAGWMTDRVVALPGDGLACKIGELRIQSLRNRAMQVLGARFDIREFHAQILSDGAVPLDMLETKIKLWMEARP